MFVGHFAVALAAKRAAPKLSLPLLFAAVQFADILWPAFILLGLEHTRIVPGITAASPLDLYDIPYSHSLVMSVVWSVVFAAPLVFARRTREAVILGVCVFSHFVLDFVTHRPDLPLYPGSDLRMGMGLWNWLWPAVLVEAALYGLGIIIYLDATRAKNQMGRYGFAALVVLLGVAWLGGPFGPPPPSITAVAWSALVLTPIVLIWAYAIERGRAPAGDA